MDRSYGLRSYGDQLREEPTPRSKLRMENGHRKDLASTIHTPARRQLIAELASERERVPAAGPLPASPATTHFSRSGTSNSSTTSTPTSDLREATLHGTPADTSDVHELLDKAETLCSQVDDDYEKYFMLRTPSHDLDERLDDEYGNDLNGDTIRLVEYTRALAARLRDLSGKSAPEVLAALSDKYNRMKADTLNSSLSIIHEVQEGHREAQKVLLQRIASLEASMSVAQEATLQSYGETQTLKARLKEKESECADLQVAMDELEEEKRKELQTLHSKLNNVVALPQNDHSRRCALQQTIHEMDMQLRSMVALGQSFQSESEHPQTPEHNVVTCTPTIPRTRSSLFFRGEDDSRVQWSPHSSFRSTPSTSSLCGSPHGALRGTPRTVRDKQSPRKRVKRMHTCRRVVYAGAALLTLVACICLATAWFVMYMGISEQGGAAARASGKGIPLPYGTTELHNARGEDLLQRAGHISAGAGTGIDANAGVRLAGDVDDLDMTCNNSQYGDTDSHIESEVALMKDSSSMDEANHHPLGAAHGTYLTDTTQSSEAVVPEVGHSHDYARQSAPTHALNQGRGQQQESIGLVDDVDVSNKAIDDARHVDWSKTTTTKPLFDGRGDSSKRKAEEEAAYGQDARNSADREGSDGEGADYEMDADTSRGQDDKMNGRRESVNAREYEEDAQWDDEDQVDALEVNVHVRKDVLKVTILQNEGSTTRSSRLRDGRQTRMHTRDDEGREGDRRDSVKELRHAHAHTKYKKDSSDQAQDNDVYDESHHDDNDDDVLQGDDVRDDDVVDSAEVQWEGDGTALHEPPHEGIMEEGDTEERGEVVYAEDMYSDETGRVEDMKDAQDDDTMGTHRRTVYVTDDDVDDFLPEAEEHLEREARSVGDAKGRNDEVHGGEVGSSEAESVMVQGYRALMQRARSTMVGKVLIRASYAWASVQLVCRIVMAVTPAHYRFFLLTIGRIVLRI